MDRRSQSQNLNLPAGRADEESPHRGIHPVQSILRHRWIALAIVVGVAGLAVPVLYRLSRPIIYAESIFTVLPVTKNPGEDRESALPRYAEFVNQQILIVAREDVCIEALNRSAEARRAWMKPDETVRDAAVRLSRTLKVTRIPDTSYVAVGLEASQEEGLVAIVNAVMRSYLDQAKSQTQYGLDSRTETLSRRATELQDEVRVKSEQLARWSKELGVPSMDPTMLQPLIEESERTQREAQGRRVAAEARLGGIEARYKVLKESNTAERAVLVPDAELLQLRTVLLARKSELKAKLFGLMPEHDGYKAIKTELGEIDAELAKEDKDALDRQIRLAAQKLEEARANETVVAQAEVADAKRYEQVIAQEMSSLKEKIHRLYPESQTVTVELERLRHQLGIVQQRLESMRLEIHSPGFVQLASTGAATELPSGKRMLKGAAMLGALALFLVLAVPVGFDLVRNRVGQDTELEGTVISIPAWKRDRRSDPAVGDQLRRVALALDRERRFHNKSAFVFTSVLPGSGTTELVLDIAHELGLFGVSALAIEANALKPDKRFCGNGHPGMAMGMSKGLRASDMVILSDGENPDRIPVGPTEGRTTLSGLEKIDSFLGQVLGRYQAVLIDAPPILRSADAEFLATRGQAVVLVVEAERTPKADLERAQRILRQAGAHVVLTVMNRARRLKDQGLPSAVTLGETS